MIDQILKLDNDGEFDSERTFNRLNNLLGDLMEAMVPYVGQTLKDDKDKSPIAEHKFKVDPEDKKNFKQRCGFLMSAFGADQSKSGAGREPLADMTALKNCYFAAKRANPEMKESLIREKACNAYNASHPTQPIGQLYTYNVIGRMTKGQKGKPAEWVEVTKP